MNTPVIIAARNEADSIGSTLDCLSRQSQDVNPIVVVNGSTDKTADIASHAGAVVLESADGKMPAIQAGLRYLGKNALTPVLLLDADSRPFTRRWSGHMSDELHGLPAHVPSMVWGPYVYKGDINKALGLFFTATTMGVSWADRHKAKPRTIRGGNTGLYIKEEELLEELLSLENFWPREDAAVFDTMKSRGASHEVTFNVNGWVLTSGYRISDTLKRAIRDRRHPSLIMDASYEDEAPVGSKPYNSDTTATARH
ncbi:MAG TPA: glycosyltransferase family A protein [Candidatus Saccharimonadales bacterium]|nr:glycosyltransferase family A protein [Candidatus Saccharimonadales bacterium]